VSRKHVLVGVMLAIVTTVLLALGHRDVGYARDEGIYFEASRRYAAWVQGDVPRDQAFAFNSEHPVLMKTARASRHASSRTRRWRRARTAAACGR
jgi:hypothetical protein